MKRINSREASRERKYKSFLPLEVIVL